MFFNSKFNSFVNVINAMIVFTEIPRHRLPKKVNNKHTKNIKSICSLSLLIFNNINKRVEFTTKKHKLLSIS